MRTYCILSREQIPSFSKVIAKVLIAIILATLVSPASGLADVVNLTPIKDTFVDQAAPVTKFGGWKQLKTKQEVSSSKFFGRPTTTGGARETLLQFDLSGIPQDAEITKAYLKLFSKKNKNFRKDNAARVYAVLEPWLQSTTWNGKPAAATTYEDSISVNGFGQYVQWDITNLVKDWVSGLEQNYGVVIRSEGGGELYFNSKESPTNKPVLYVEYNNSGVEEPQDIAVEANPSNGEAPLTVNFKANVLDGSTGMEYRWDFEGDGIVDEIGPSNQVSYTYYDSGEYNASVEVFTTSTATADASGSSYSTSSKGGKGSTKVRVTGKPSPTPTPTPTPISNQPPTLNLQASPSSGTAPLLVTFESNASDPDGSIVEYRWDTNGDGTFDDVTTSNPYDYVYMTSGTYNARVEVVDNMGMTASDTVTVTVSSNPEPTPSPTPTPTPAPQPNGPAFYISPNGSDSNAGTSDKPFKTFSFALKQLLPGDTLILKNGTYTKATTGLPDINCGSGISNGTSTKPITIKAENERQAFIQGDGSKDTFLIRYCSWWNIEGLRGENADNSNNTSTGHVFGIRDSSNINAKRLLARFPNRYANVHAIAVIDSNNILVEESEAYSFHRHGIMFFRSDNVTHRRNYANARDYPAIGTGSPGENNLNTGDECISFYQTNDGLNENSIAERCGSNFTAHGDGGKGKRNKLLGAISVSGERSLRYESRTNTTASRIEDAIIQDFVAVNATVIGMYLRSTVNSQISNVTVYNNAGHGFAADLLNNNQSTSASFTCINCLSFNNSNRGFSSTNQASWLINFSNSQGNGTNYHPSETINDNSGNIRNSFSIAPSGMGLGTNQCIVYVPNGSNMQGAGKGGADIGANIIYRYENGALSQIKLWNQSTGQFPCGATVIGVNDDTTFPNSACVNVHKRLNVGVNGCPIP